MEEIKRFFINFKTNIIDEYPLYTILVAAAIVLLIVGIVVAVTVSKKKKKAKKKLRSPPERARSLFIRRCLVQLRGLQKAQASGSRIRRARSCRRCRAR